MTKSIEYCKECKGNPYYIVTLGKVRKYKCAKCDSYLEYADVDVNELRKNFIPMKSYLLLTEEQIQERLTCFSQPSEDSHMIDTHIVDDYPANESVDRKKQIYVETTVDNEEEWFREQLKEKKSMNIPHEETEVPEQKKEHNHYITRENSRSIYGKVMNVSSDSGEYKRLMPVKLYEKIRYRQRMSDVLNTITVQLLEGDGIPADGDIRVDIVFHGNVEGGIGIIQQGANIRAAGKLKQGESKFYADTITYDDRRPIRIDVGSADSAVLMIPIIFVALFVLLWQFIPDGMTFGLWITYLKNKLLRFFIWDAVLTGIISMLLYVRTRRRISGLMRRIPAIPYSRCLGLGLVLATVISAFIAF